MMFSDHNEFCFVLVTITGENDERKNKPQNIDVGERARSRWRNAIHNQILLIRMEKENKKLAGTFITLSQMTFKIM